MTTFERSLQQRRDALAEANRIRSLRARGKEVLAVDRSWDALIALVEALKPPRDADGAPIGSSHDWETAKIYNVLVASRMIGVTKANTILKRAKVSPSKTLGGLTFRQRRELANVLREFVARRDKIVYQQAYRAPRQAA